MFYNNINAKIKSTHSEYLSTLDLINKYNIKDRKDVPILNKIIVSFPIIAFLNKFFGSTKTEFDPEIQIKSIVIFYLLFFNPPFVKYKKNVKITKNLKTRQNFLCLKITLTNCESINKFLYQLFFENTSNNSTFKNLTQNCNTNIVGFTFPIQKFFEFNQLVLLTGLESISNEFFLNIKFFFNQNQKFDGTIKNIYPFWIEKKK